jgi:hypothetical protein
MPGMFGAAPVPPQVTPHPPQDFPAYQNSHAAVPPQPVSSPPAAAPPQMPGQQIPPQPVSSPPAVPPPQMPGQQVPPQPIGPQPVASQSVPGQGAPAAAGPVTSGNGPAPEGRAAGRAQVPESALLPAHQLPALPPPVPRVYGRAAADAAPQPAPAHHPQAQHQAAHYSPAQHPVAVHPAQAPVEPAPVSPPPVSPPPAYPHQPATPHIADPQSAAPNSPGSPYAPTGTPSPASPAFPPFAPPQQMAHSTLPAGGIAPSPPFGQPVGAPAYPPTEPPRPDPATPAGFPAQPAPVTPPQAPDGYQRPPEQSRSQTVMLISVGLVVLLAVVGLIAFTWPRDRSTPETFPIGTCVKESPEGRPVKAGCGDAGAYRVESAQSSKDQCPDQTQPHIDLGSGDKRILCLTPAEDPATASD